VGVADDETSVVEDGGGFAAEEVVLDIIDKKP